MTLMLAPLSGWSVMYSRAGLVALVFVLIISLVSAVPIPIHPELSSTLSQRDLIQRDVNGLTRTPLNSPISRVPAITGALIGDNAPLDADNQLVPRGLGAKIRKAFHKIGHAIKHVAKKIGSGIKKAAKKIGSGIKKAAKKVGSGIKKAAKKVGSGIKKAAKKVGSGIKKAAKKVGHFVKTTGAKIAKFGLKVISTAQEALGKAVGFIPGVGKAVGKTLEAASKVTGFVSDKIHANLGKKLEKGMSVMNKASKVMGYIPRRRDLSDEDIEEDFYW